MVALMLTIEEVRPQAFAKGRKAALYVRRHRDFKPVSARREQNTGRPRHL
jgi:hypothetical protein